MGLHPAPAPEDAASPTSPAPGAAPSARSTVLSHGKSLSVASAPSPSATSNRFSIHFPIQVSGPSTPAPATSPARGVAAEVSVAEALARLQNGMPDGGSCLSLIASQERRVLELKEELHRAEADLDKLKRQWARHEVQKKREGVKRLAILQPLQTSLPPNDAEEDADGGSSAWMQHETERRRLLLLSKTNPMGGRTVLPGQRHTRALSLLSPARDNIRDTAAPAPQRPPPPRRDSLKNRPSLDGAPEPPSLMEPGADAADAAAAVDRTADPDVDPAHRARIDQEAFFQTGKKMAAEFKDGLWTFWEDLRQATVGEESGPIQPPRRQSSTQTLRSARTHGSRGSLRPSSRGSSTVSKASDHTVKPPSPGRSRTQPAPSALPDLADPSFWAEHGVAASTPTAPAATNKAAASKHAASPTLAKRLSIASNGDPWDTWDDSPDPSRSGSSVTSDAGTLPSTVSGSPRTSLSLAASDAASTGEREKRDALAWPALKKSGAAGLGRLKRTASHLMQDWENSVNPGPSPGDTTDAPSACRGVSADAEAYGAGSM